MGSGPGEMEGEELLEVMAALEVVELLGRVLAGLKGEGLDPGRACDRLEGLGALAALVSSERWRGALEAALGAGDDLWGLWVLWNIICEEEVLVGRASAVIFEGWGWSALGMGDVEGGGRWLSRAMGLHERVLGDDGGLEGLLAGQAGVGIGALGRARAGVWRALLEAQGRGAVEALEARDWDRALMHWGLVVRWWGGEEEGERWRGRCVGGLLAQIKAVEDAAISRGVGGGEEAALELAVMGLGVEPEAWLLRRRCVEVGVRAAWSLSLRGDEGGLSSVGEALEESARWCGARSAMWEGDVGFRGVLVEALLLAAYGSREPEVALGHVEAALALDPEHPTAPRLLGEAQAALSARRLGAGRIAEARALAAEASLVVGQSEAFERLVVALGRAAGRGGEPR